MRPRFRIVAHQLSFPVSGLAGSSSVDCWGGCSLVAHVRLIGPASPVLRIIASRIIPGKLDHKSGSGSVPVGGGTVPTRTVPFIRTKL